MEENSNKSELKGRKARMAVHVTDVEKHLDPTKAIYTKTDLKGKITYANPAFCEISGFTEEEMLGQPHNMVRHPDMPPDAFKDLWQTIREGQPWRGLVKNRCKDGGFYWVKAFVTPITEKGKKTGYMSVRFKPTEEEKREADRLYKSISGGHEKFPFTKIKRGRPLFVDLALAIVIPHIIVTFAFLFGTEYFLIVEMVGLSAALAGFFWVCNLLNGGLKKLKQVAVSLSEGDFSTEVPDSGNREFRDLLTIYSGALVNLRAVILDVIDGSKNVTTGAEGLDFLSGKLKQRTEKQSDGIEGVASALEEMSASVAEISEATKKSASNASEALSIVDEGGKSIVHSTKATQDVSNVVQTARKSVEELHQAVERIGLVTQTIENIAENTNLLALNAAIEAARAGESGRGFAVVADEVRKLAEMTRESTTEISATISDV